VEFELIIGVTRIGIGCALVWKIAQRWSTLFFLPSSDSERGLAPVLGFGPFWVHVASC